MSLSMGVLWRGCASAVRKLQLFLGPTHTHTHMHKHTQMGSARTHTSCISCCSGSYQFKVTEKRRVVSVGANPLFSVSLWACVCVCWLLCRANPRGSQTRAGGRAGRPSWGALSHCRWAWINRARIWSETKLIDYDLCRGCTVYQRRSVVTWQDVQRQVRRINSNMSSYNLQLSFSMTHLWGCPSNSA